MKIKVLQGKIVVLKAKLQSTDYMAIKFAEGLLTETEYAKTKEQREQWRAEINAIETQIKGLE